MDSVEAGGSWGVRGHAGGSLVLLPWAGGPQGTWPRSSLCGQAVGAAWRLGVSEGCGGRCALWQGVRLTRASTSAQFTAKQLEKLAKKAEKDSKAEQAKVKKVSQWPPRGSLWEGHAPRHPDQVHAAPVFASDWPRLVSGVLTPPFSQIV